MSNYIIFSHQLETPQLIYTVFFKKASQPDSPKQHNTTQSTFQSHHQNIVHKQSLKYNEKQRVQFQRKFRSTIHQKISKIQQQCIIIQICYKDRKVNYADAPQQSEINKDYNGLIQREDEYNNFDNIGIIVKTICFNIPVILEIYTSQIPKQLASKLSKTTKTKGQIYIDTFDRKYLQTSSVASSYSCQYHSNHSRQQNVQIFLYPFPESSFTSEKGKNNENTKQIKLFCLNPLTNQTKLRNYSEFIKISPKQSQTEINSENLYRILTLTYTQLYKSTKYNLPNHIKQQDVTFILFGVYHQYKNNKMNYNTNTNTKTTGLQKYQQNQEQQILLVNLLYLQVYQKKISKNQQQQQQHVLILQAKIDIQQQFNKGKQQQKQQQFQHQIIVKREIQQNQNDQQFNKYPFQDNKLFNINNLMAFAQLDLLKQQHHSKTQSRNESANNGKINKSIIKPKIKQLQNAYKIVLSNVQQFQQQHLSNMNNNSNNNIVNMQNSWQSSLQLQYKLKNNIKRLLFCNDPTINISINNINNNNDNKIYNNNNNKINRYYYTVRFYLSQHQLYLLMVYNYQTYIQNIIEYYSTNYNNNNNNNGCECFREEYYRLNRINRLKYPLAYYNSILKKYQQFQQIIKIMNINIYKSIQSQQKCIRYYGYDKLRLNSHEIVKICKYLLIQNISKEELQHFIATTYRQLHNNSIRTSIRMDEFNYYQNIQSNLYNLDYFKRLPQLTSITQLQLPSPLPQSFIPLRQTIQKFQTQLTKILNIPNNNLIFNHTDCTLMIYWILGPPGSHKTTIYNNLRDIIQEYHNAQTITLTQISQSSSSASSSTLNKLLQFVTNPKTFIKQKYAFCLIDDYFTINKLQQLVKIINNLAKINSKIFYQIGLITSQMSNPATFVSEFCNGNLHRCDNINDNQANNVKNQSNSSSASCSSIITQYHFPLQYLICAILQIQKRPINYQNANKNSLLTIKSQSLPQPQLQPQSQSQSYLYGQGTQSLSKILHYISSTYSNLDLSKLIKNIIFSGEIKIIQYQSSTKYKINWQQNIINQYQKQQIQDQFKILLEKSYKKIIQDDVLLSYFLENVQEVQHSVCVLGIAEEILEKTFQVLPYYFQIQQREDQYLNPRINRQFLKN